MDKLIGIFLVWLIGLFVTSIKWMLLDCSDSIQNNLRSIARNDRVVVCFSIHLNPYYWMPLYRSVAGYYRWAALPLIAVEFLSYDEKIRR